jgi:hypothetical protein
MEARERLLDLLVRPSHLGVSAQVVTEEEGVALVGPTRLPDVQIGASLLLWLAEEQLAPFLKRLVAARR